MKKKMDPDPAGQKSTDPTGSGSSSMEEWVHVYHGFTTILFLMKHWSHMWCKRYNHISSFREVWLLFPPQAQNIPNVNQVDEETIIHMKLQFRFKCKYCDSCLTRKAMKLHMRRMHPEKVDLNAVAQSLINEGIIDEIDSSYYTPKPGTIRKNNILHCYSVFLVHSFQRTMFIYWNEPLVLDSVT